MLTESKEVLPILEIVDELNGEIFAKLDDPRMLLDLRTNGSDVIVALAGLTLWSSAHENRAQLSNGEYEDLRAFIIIEIVKAGTTIQAIGAALLEKAETVE